MEKAFETVLWKLPHSVRHSLIKSVLSARYREWQELRRAPSEATRGGPLWPFVEHRCIFVHIPKTAGISVNAGLFGRDTGHHRQIAVYQAVFTPREYRSFFKFAFVRNPWDRVVSAYLFLKQGGLHDIDKRWAEQHLVPYASFDAFVRGWLTPENVRTGVHFIPQADYIRLPGRSGHELDFVGYFENLNDDYDRVRKVLKTGLPLAAKNVTANKHRDYRSYYTAETRAIVAEVYREDIELLGYTFDNGSLSEQLAQRAHASKVTAT